MRFTSIIAAIPFAVPASLPMDVEESADTGIIAFKPVTEALREETLTSRPNEIIFDEDVVTEKISNSEKVVQGISDRVGNPVVLHGHRGKVVQGISERVGNPVVLHGHRGKVVQEISDRVGNPVVLRGHAPKKDIIIDAVSVPTNETEILSIGDNLGIPVSGNVSVMGSELPPSSSAAADIIAIGEPIRSITNAVAASTTKASNQSEFEIFKPENPSVVFRASFGCVGISCYSTRREPARDCYRRRNYLRSYYTVPSYCY